MIGAYYQNLHTGSDTSARPRVSIIILNWNKSTLTVECVDRVRRHTRAVTYEIIVVDNGSSPSDFEALKRSLVDVHLVSLTENMFFGEGNNIAAEVARGEFLLFLNNDVLVSSDCVDRLVVQFDGCFSAGAIGPKFLYPNGALQEAGGFLTADGWSVQQGKMGLKVAPHFDHGCHIVDYCSAACLLVKREVFLSLAGFDPLFDPAYFEDCDLCLRLRSIGLYTYYASDIEVVHEENVTSAEMWNRERLDAIIVRNHQKFVNRWGHYLANRLDREVQFPQFPTIPDIEPLTPARADDKRVLLRCESNIRMSDDTYAMLRCAAALGKRFRVVIATPEISSRIRIRSICQKLDLRLGSFDMTRLSDENEKSYDEVISFPNSEVDQDCSET